MTDQDNSRAIARAEKKIDRSRQFILQKECFFSTVLMRLKVEMDEHSTMSTDGTTWRWGWRFVDEASQAKVNFVNLHERAHEALFHCTRLLKLKDKKLGNIAADHVVNIMITRMGLTQQFSDENFRKLDRDWVVNCLPFKNPSYKMPEDGVMDCKFAGMTLEEVYNILAKEADEQEARERPCEEGEEGKEGSEGEGGNGGEGSESDEPAPWGSIEEAVNEETGEPLTPEEIKEVEQKLSQDLANSENIAKKRGQMPGILGENVKLAQTVSQDWRDVLRDLLTDTIAVDYAFTRQDTHNIGARLVSPGILKEGMGHLAVFPDASGSVSQGEYGQFMTDLTEICDELQPETITLVQFDWEASEPEIIDRGDAPELVRKRRGGTRFSAPFEKCEKLGILDDFDAIVVFTDGGDNNYPEEPSCPVIWASTGAFWGGPPPFGETVQVRFGRD